MSYRLDQMGSEIDEEVDNHTISKDLGDSLKHKYEAYGKGIESVGQVTDFVKDNLPGEGGSTPSVIKAEMSFSGTISYSSDVMKVRIANPGSKASNNRPALYSSSDPMVYPAYNIPLGVFAMLKRPDVQFYQTYQNPYDDVTITAPFNYKKQAWKLNSAINYTYNPALNIDYANSYIKGSWVVESLVNEFGNEADAVMDIQEFYETEYGEHTGDIPGYTKKVVYTTDFMDLTELSKYTPTLEYLHDYSSYPSQNTLYLKLLVYIQYNDVNKNGVPFYYTTVVKYPVNPSPATSDISGIPMPNNTPTIPGSTFTKTSYGPLTIGATTYNTQNNNGIITGQVQNIYVTNDLTINGNLILGQGVQQVNFITGDQIIQDCESVIGCEFILGQRNPNPVQVSSPVISNSSIKTSYCPDNNQYKAYQVSAARLGSNNLYTSPIQNNPTLNLIVYPNPIQSQGEISYSLPQGDHV
jgi:hypothetical protein